MNLNYSINGIPFSSMGIIVSESNGIIDGLQLKEPYSVPWPDAHGEVVDLLRPRFEAREIKLDCFIVASSPDTFTAQLNGLKAELLKSGTQRLRVNPIDGKPMVYEVYCRSGFSIDKKWRDGKMIGKFTLPLTEPQPIKWVLSGTSGSTASLTISAPSPITIYWGDGTNDSVMGANQTVTHSYGGSGATYYAIVTGELERMTLHSKSSLTEIWPRLY